MRQHSNVTYLNAFICNKYIFTKYVRLVQRDTYNSMRFIAKSIEFCDDSLNIALKCTRVSYGKPLDKFVEIGNLNEIIGHISPE